MRALALFTLLCAAACSRAPAPGPAPHQIRLVGASAGLPFAEDAAERYTLGDPRAIAPLAQADGSTSGIARFCGGLGARHPDLAIATREMTAAERSACVAHGVARIVEVRFGWSAMVLVARAGEGPAGLTSAQAAAALAGTATRWSAIEPALPDAPIAIVGPAPGTVMGDAPPWPGAIRRDGRYRAMGADADLVAGTVLRTPGTIGLLPYPYALRDGLRAIPIDGVAPTPAMIASGRYPGRMPLLLFVKANEAGVVPGLPALLRRFMDSIDPGGAFMAKGLVPLDRADRDAARRALAIPPDAA
jgi:phosphate transport system substrate-binding protein